MSAPHVSPPAAACPPNLDELQQQIHHRRGEIIAFCLRDPGPTTFLDFETTWIFPAMPGWIRHTIRNVPVFENFSV